jgi:hypothetical protein
VRREADRGDEDGVADHRPGRARGAGRAHGKTQLQRALGEAVERAADAAVVVAAAHNRKAQRNRRALQRGDGAAHQGRPTARTKGAEHDRALQRGGGLSCFRAASIEGLDPKPPTVTILRNVFLCRGPLCKGISSLTCINGE